MKKILTVLFSLLLLFGCANNTEMGNETNNNDEEIASNYIEPAQLVNYADYINDGRKQQFIDANESLEKITNNDLKRIGKELPDLIVNDYYGNVLNFASLKNKKVIFEMVAEWCSNCKLQSKKYTEELLTNLPNDIVFIQFFNAGDVDEIVQFYKEIDVVMPSNIIIIPENEELTKYLKEQLNVEYFPTFLFFNNGVLTWTKWGSLASVEYDKSKILAFENPLNASELVDNNGKSIFSYGRSAETVEDQLLESNINKLKEIDEDQNDVTYITTLNVIGNFVDYTKILEKDINDLPLIDDYSKYEDKNVIVFYTVLDSKVSEDYAIINEIIQSNPDYEYIVLLKNGTDSTITYNNEIFGASVSMSNKNVPNTLLDLKIEKVPTAVFIEKGYITGAIAAIKDSSKVSNNLSLFFGDSAIALKSNNQ